MAAPPKVFISAVSDEFHGVRQVVKDALLAIDCCPVEGADTKLEWRAEESALRSAIDDCQAMIHIVGIRYGTEPTPASVPKGIQRRSVAQMEYCIGRALQKRHGERRFRVYTFVCPPDFSYDKGDVRHLSDEAGDLQAIQNKHRAFLLKDPQLSESPADVAAIRETILALREPMIELRNRQVEVERKIRKTRRFVAWAVALGLIFVVGAGWGVSFFNHRANEKLRKTVIGDLEPLRARLREYIDKSTAAAVASERAGKNDGGTIESIGFDRNHGHLKAEEAIATIRAGLAWEPDPVMLKAAHILDAKGSAEAAAYLENRRESLFADAAHLTGQGLDTKRRREAKLRPLLLLAEVYECQLERRLARPLLEELVTRAPNWFAARNELGELYYKSGAFSEAAATLRLAETLAATDGERVVALSNLIWMMNFTKRNVEEKAALRRLLSIQGTDFGKDEPKVAILFNNLGKLLMEQEWYPEAEPLLRRALAMSEADLGKDNPQTGAMLNNLALLLKDTHREDEAASLLQRAMAIDKTNPSDFSVHASNMALLLEDKHRLGESEALLRQSIADDEANHPENQTSLAAGIANLALVLKDTNRIAEAETMFRRALAIYETNAAKSSPDAARLLSNFGRLLRETSRLDEAESLFRRALTASEASLGKDHPDISIRLNDLALVLQDSGRLGEAESLIRRALNIDEATGGKDNSAVGRDLCNLALVLEDANRPREAEPMLRRSLAITKASLGGGHPDFASVLAALAQLLKDTGRTAEAEPLFRRALAIDETTHVKDHPKVAHDLRCLALLLQAMNRLNEAEPLLRHALAIHEAVYGEKHPEVSKDLSDLAVLLRAMNRRAEAVPLIRRALALDEARYGSNHLSVSWDLNTLAQLLKYTNRVAEAEPLMRRVVSIQEASYGKDSPLIATALNNLGQLLADTNRITEAEPLLRRSVALDETSPDKDDPEITTHLNNLAMLLDGTQRQTEAEPLLRRAVVTLLKSYATSRIQDPGLETVLGNYLSICRDLQISLPETKERLEQLRKDAGLDPAAFWQILHVQPPTA